MPSLIPKTLSIAVAAAVIAAHQASATLTIDVRVVAVDGVPAPNPKCFSAFTNSRVTFDVYAIVTGAAGAPGLEGFQIAVGSILSNTDPFGTMGDVESHAPVSPFGAAGSSVGSIADLDGDGDLDVGSNATVVADVNSIAARSSAMTTGNASGLGASEFKFYSFNLIIGGLRLGSPFGINWRKTDFTGLTTEYIWQEDGVLTNSRGVNGGSVAGVQLGSPILFTLACPVDTPEPSVFGMAVAGALGLAGFRRSGR